MRWRCHKGQDVDKDYSTSYMQREEEELQEQEQEKLTLEDWRAAVAQRDGDRDR